MRRPGRAATTEFFLHPLERSLQSLTVTQGGRPEPGVKGAARKRKGNSLGLCEIGVGRGWTETVRRG